MTRTSCLSKLYAATTENVVPRSIPITRWNSDTAGILLRGWLGRFGVGGEEVAHLGDARERLRRRRRGVFGVGRGRRLAPLDEPPEESGQLRREPVGGPEGQRLGGGQRD